MAEAVGVALSGVAIGSLLTTCVEFLEYFDNGRHWVCDFSMALTKVDLMKVRLHHLQETLPSNTSEDYGRVLRQDRAEDWPIANGLLGIDRILSRASKLCTRYSFHTQGAYLDIQPRYWYVWGRRISWALRDKNKFEGLITDLDFFLSNLERITSGVDSLSLGDSRSRALHDSLKTAQLFSFQGSPPSPRRQTTQRELAEHYFIMPEPNTSKGRAHDSGESQKTRERDSYSPSQKFASVSSAQPATGPTSAADPVSPSVTMVLARSTLARNKVEKQSFLFLGNQVEVTQVTTESQCEGNTCSGNSTFLGGNMTHEFLKTLTEASVQVVKPKTK